MEVEDDVKVVVPKKREAVDASGSERGGDAKRQRRS